MRVLGITPVRGGSKGVPGKNIKMLGGKPLVQYSIDAAKRSRLLTRYIVSTESEEIAGLVRSWGEGVPFLRPAALAEDHTPTLPVIQHALKFFEEQRVYFDAVCILQATNPFRVPGFIDRAISRFIEMNCDALISVLPVPAEYNPHWTFETEPGGFLKIATGEKKIIARRQDLPEAFIRDGSVYITRTTVIMEQNSLYGSSLGYIESHPEWYVNIDTPADWLEAEKIVEKFKKQCAE